MNPSGFVDVLANLRFDGTFNPYSDHCECADVRDAAEIRRENLKLVLEAALSEGVSSVWIARDLGYRGGRRTGLALTDDVHLAAHSGIYGDLPLRRATRGPAIAERTAAVIWRAISHLESRVFLWNVFPLHPHTKGDPLSNRCHSRAEGEACRPLIVWLLEKLQPEHVVAIGRDAETALQSIGVKASRLRHPSYGGQREFLEGVSSQYGLTCITEQHAALTD